MLASTRIRFDHLRVLVVDDNLLALDLLTAILTGFGVASVMQATDAEAAIEALKTSSFGLVFTDASMPGRDGYDLTKWLRQQPVEALRMTPLIVVTGHTPRRDVERARDCGADFILAKPIAPVTVLERMLWVLRRPRPFVECETYVGPDRRWKHLGAPIDFPEGRRCTDPVATIGIASDGELSPDEIALLVRPKPSMVRRSQKPNTRLALMSG